MFIHTNMMDLIKRTKYIYFNIITEVGTYCTKYVGNMRRNLQLIFFLNNIKKS